MKIQYTGGGKIFANHISDKGLVPEHIKNSYNSTVKKQTTGLKKSAKDLSKYFSWEDTQMANKHTKDARRHRLLGKCKLELQRDTTSYSQRWP